MSLFEPLRAFAIVPKGYTERMLEAKMKALQADDRRAISP